MTVSASWQGHATAELAAIRITEVELFTLAGHDGFLREVNAGFARLLGLTVDEIEGHSLLELTHPADLTAVVQGLSDLQAGAAEVLVENRFRSHDDSWTYLQWVARPVPGTDLWWAVGRDTTHVHALLLEELNLRARLDLAIGHTSAAMWDLDMRTGYVTWEPHAVRLFDTSPDELPGTMDSLAALVHPADQNAVRTVVNDQLRAAGTCEVSLRVGAFPDLRHLSLRGKVLERDRRGRPLRAVGLLLDVSAEKAMEEQMLRMAMSDALTGVPNRRAFDQTLRAEWRNATRTHEPISVVMIDIDNFKVFNDTFGHQVGDDALCTTARTLSACVDADRGHLARFGGEEFVLVLPGATEDAAALIADAIVQTMRTVTLTQAPAWQLSVSVGTASWKPGQGSTKAAELVSRADRALYAAKRAGKDRAVVYERELAATSDLERRIVAALENNEFELFYQPITRLETGRIIAAETLLRWHTDTGTVTPDEFLPVAEQSQLICRIDEWVLRKAVTQLQQWLDGDLVRASQFRLTVNVSARHVADPAIVSTVAELLANTTVPPRCLELELTETALASSAHTAKHLAGLRALGARVAIDDFGTGYTSIGQLAHLPADVLKIDRSFVDSSDQRAHALIPLIINAAHTFDLTVTAEGIETNATLDELSALGCDHGQGYLLGRPMPAAEFARQLEARRR